MNERTAQAGSRKERAARTAADLKAAARRVFDRQGYLNTKITDITAEAGRATGSFYTHFADKESLLEAMFADMMAESNANVRSSTTHSPDFSDPEAVRWHVAAFWTFFSRHRTELVAVQQAALVDPRFAVRFRDLYAPEADELRDHLERAEAAGVRLPADAPVVATMISALMLQFAMMWLAGPDMGRTLGDDEAIEALTRFIVHGLHGSGR